MPDSPRYRAEVTGHFVQFYSTNPKAKTVRWHSRFKCEYHTLRDARTAKVSYESTGKILWFDDLTTKAAKAPPRRETHIHAQPELRL